MRKYLEEELLPAEKLTNEFVLQGLIYDAKAKTSYTHTSVFLRMFSKKGGPFIVHLDCNEPRAQYSGGAWHLQNKCWSFDYINWPKFSERYSFMQLWRLKSSRQNEVRLSERTDRLTRIIETAPIEKGPDSDEALRKLLREQTLPARTAKQLKKAKHIWANQRHREAMSGTLPSLTGLKLTRKTELDYTLHQEFIPLSDSDIDSESEGTSDQGLIKIPVPQGRLASL